MATQKQIDYCNLLLEFHDENGTLEEVIYDINPKLGEDESFEEWFAVQSVKKASEVISYLSESREDYR